MTARDDALEKSARDFADALRKLVDGEDEAAVAKLVVAVAVVVLGSPWMLLAEPILARTFFHLNNGPAKKAVAAIAKQVAAEEEQRALLQQIGDRLRNALNELFLRIDGALASSAADTLAGVGLQISRMEDRLLSKLVPHSDVWRALNPRVQFLADETRPSALLTAAYQAVPFVARPSVLQKLDGFVESNASQALAIVTGAGGVGKTRLAMELNRQWRSKGLASGFLTRTDSDAPREVLSGSDKRIIVIDYPEGKLAQLEAVLRALASGSTPPTRLVLLARSRGDLLKRLAGLPETNAQLVHDALQLDLGSAELRLSIEERLKVWRGAVKQFGGDAVRVSEPADLNHERWARPLLLLVHALISARGHPPETEPELLEHVLEAEARHYVPIVRALANTEVERDEFRHLCSDLLAVVTLLGGIEDPARLRPVAAARLQERFGYEQAGPVVVERLVSKLAELYPQDLGMAPMMPDLLGEELVVTQLGRWRSLVSATAEVANSQTERQSILRVLGRCAMRSGTQALISGLLTEKLGAFGTAALEVAAEGTQSSKLVAIALEGRLDVRDEAALQMSLEISSMLPPRTTMATNSIAVAANTVAADLAHETATRAPTEQNLSTLSDLLLPLSARLRGADSPAASLHRSRQAVDVSRQLLEGNREKHLTRYTASLCSLSGHLLDNDLREEALRVADDALQHARELAELHKEPAHGFVIVALCKRASALLAMDEYQAAVVDFRSATELSALLPPGEEAWETMAVSNAGLADSLSRAARWKEALPAASVATGIFRNLAARYPDAYYPQLARSLGVLARSLAGVSHRGEEGIARAREARQILEKLAEDWPMAFNQGLAAAWYQEACCHVAIDDYSAAVGPARMAVALYEELIGDAVYKGKGGSERFVPACARAKYELGIAVTHTEPAAAIDVLNEALSTFKQLATLDENYEVSVGLCVCQLGSAYNRLGEHGKALVVLDEAWRVLRAPKDMNNPKSKTQMAICRMDQATAHFGLGQHAQGFSAISDALMRLRGILHEGSAPVEVVLVHAMAIMAKWLKQARQNSELRELMSQVDDWSRKNNFEFRVGIEPQA